MISAITCTINDVFMKNVFDNYVSQTLEEKELVIVLNKNSMNIEKWREQAMNYQNIRIFCLDESATLGDCLNFAVERVNHEIIAKMDDDDYYGRNYLKEAMELFKAKPDVAVLGKNCYYVYLDNIRELVIMNDTENDYTDHLAGGTIIFKKALWDKIKFEKVNKGEDYFFQRAVLDSGYKIFSGERYNYVCIRRNDGHHTWKVDHDFFLKWGKLLDCSRDFREIVER